MFSRDVILFSNAVTCIGPVGLFETKPTVHSAVINQSQAGWLERATDNLMAPRNKTLSLQQEAIPLSRRTWVVLLDYYTWLLWLIIFQSPFLLNESVTPANDQPVSSSEMLSASLQQERDTPSSIFVCATILSHATVGLTSQLNKLIHISLVIALL